MYFKVLKLHILLFRAVTLELWSNLLGSNPCIIESLNICDKDNGRQFTFASAEKASTVSCSLMAGISQGCLACGVDFCPNQKSLRDSAMRGFNILRFAAVVALDSPGAVMFRQPCRNAFYPFLN